MFPGIWAVLRPGLPYAALAVVGGGWYEANNAHQRALGALQEQLKARDAQIATLTQRRDSILTVFKTDTLRLVAYRTRYDTVVSRLLDTILVHHTTLDTVRVPVHVLVTADSAYRACGRALASCEALAATEHQRADLYRLQLGDVLKTQPGFFRRWGERVALFGVGVLGGRAIR